MPRLPQYNSTKLFHKLAREVKNDFIQREGRKPNRDEWNQIQKWTSKNLYKEFKGLSYRKVSAVRIKDEIFVRSAPKEKISCGDPFIINPQIYQLVDWWDIWNSIQGLPRDVQVRVNAGNEFGVTQISQVQFLEYEPEINEIVERIREYTGNKSAEIYFEGVIKVVSGKKDDGQPCSYFIDYVLADEDGLIDKTEGVKPPDEIVLEDDRERVKREKEATRKARQRKIDKVKNAKTAKRPKSVVEEKSKKKKKKGKKGKKKKKPEVRNRVAEMREAERLYKEKVIDKNTLKELLLEIAKKKDGGIV